MMILSETIKAHLFKIIMMLKVNSYLNRIKYELYIKEDTKGEC